MKNVDKLIMRLIIKLLLRNDGHRITETKGKNNWYFHPTALILIWDQIHLADYPRSILYNDLTDFPTNISITTLLMFANLGWLVKQAWACLTFGLTYDDLFFETLVIEPVTVLVHGYTFLPVFSIMGFAPIPVGVADWLAHKTTKYPSSFCRWRRCEPTGHEGWVTYIQTDKLVSITSVVSCVFQPVSASCKAYMYSIGLHLLNSPEAMVRCIEVPVCVPLHTGSSGSPVWLAQLASAWCKQW